jgi:hypothetical protein
MVKMKMETVKSSEILVSYRIITWCHNPEDLGREDLKSRKISFTQPGFKIRLVKWI